MKKIIVYLLTAVLLVGSGTTLEAQNKKDITTSEANKLLQKTIGNWRISSYEWQPETQKFVETTGNASFNKAYQGNYIKEQFEIKKTDGSIVTGEGFLRYSETSKRFEFVQLDDEGESIVLMVGEWRPEYNLLTLSSVKETESFAIGNSNVAHWQYFFLEDGSIKKIVRKPNAKGLYVITATNHYVPANTAGL
ncbi:DUF1579 family protein [Pontibacter silvestris]|uniref:DUF1579 family protein n=1 Tax=Pontibacter silvestris TaxID=2305183 RepID=A0ABW4X1P6_9BACT|nr:DUF1579 family protein [Pontibacter silvestris]MCC9136087.1 DUF1579 domain-containing protein [Pontibacter silvestris]